MKSNAESTTSKVSYADVLIRAGLDEKEAKTYEALLKYGQLGIGALLTKLPYKRGDLYNILYGLRDKGLVTQTLNNRKIAFRPNEPHHLETYVLERKEKLQEAQTVIGSVLPNLTELYRLTTDKPIVRVFEGFEGLKELYQDTISTNQPITAFLGLYEAEPRLRQWLAESYVTERVEHKIPARVLVATDLKDKEGKNYAGLDKQELRESRVIDRDKFPCRLEVQVYGNKVSFTNHNKNDAQVGVLIDNKLIAESIQSLLDLAWANSDQTYLIQPSS